MKFFLAFIFIALLVNLSRFNNWALLTVGGVLFVTCVVVYVRAMHSESVQAKKEN